jgi:hypothetical protein
VDLYSSSPNRRLAVIRSFVPVSLIALGLAAGVLPASAGDAWRLYQHHDPYWHAIHDAIYAQHNHIAFLQADPYILDCCKAATITAARADMRRLDALLPPPEWRWSVPCCYSRAPIYLARTARKSGSKRRGSAD